MVVSAVVVKLAPLGVLTAVPAGMVMVPEVPFLEKTMSPVDLMARRRVMTDGCTSFARWSRSSPTARSMEKS